MTTTRQPLPSNYLRLVNLMAKAGEAIGDAIIARVGADDASEAGKRMRLIKRIREAKLPGCNACSRWSTATLLRKCGEADAAGKIS